MGCSPHPADYPNVTDATSLTAALRRGPNPLRGEAPVQRAANPLRILFLVSAHNSLSQRAQIALTELGHKVEVEVVETGEAMEIAVERHRPELIVCPILKKIIPESIYSRHRCLIVHPGPVGDRGASSLDWAIELGMGEWGVTVLEATGEVDGGDIWGTHNFRTRETGKSSIYRHEVRRAAIASLLDAMAALEEPEHRPRRLDYADPSVVGRPRPLIRQPERAIDWTADSTETVVRRIRAAEGHPGVLDTIAGAEFHLFGVHRELGLRGRPGEIIATRHGGICRATVDGAVWITHLKRPDHFKLPAVRALELAGISARRAGDRRAYPRADPRRSHVARDRLHRRGRGRLPALRLLQRRHEHRPVPAPARGLPLRARPPHDQGHRAHRRERLLLQRHPPQRDRGGAGPGHRVLAQPARHRRRRARDRGDRLAPGDLGAGRRRGRGRRAVRDGGRPRRGPPRRRAQPLLPAHGRPLRLRVLHVPDAAPHRRRADRASSRRRRSARSAPAGRSRSACSTRRSATTPRASRPRSAGSPSGSPRHDDHARWLEEKRRRRAVDEQIKPLSVYRTEELARSHECFFGADRSYHEARSRFVYKTGAPCKVSAPAADNQAMDLLRASVGQVAA